MEPYFVACETLAHAEAEALAKTGRVLSAANLKALQDAHSRSAR